MRFILYLFLFFSLVVSAQKTYVIKYKGNSNTSYSEHTSESSYFSQNLDRLAQQITKGKSTDSEKIEAIYLWIAQNIAYDHELRFNKTLQEDYYQSQEKVITKVLQRQKALCGGYALLFEILCGNVGVEAKTIHGFTKLTTNFQRPNHSWNAVKVNGKWQLLDITWSISNGKLKTPDKSWFLTNPEIFIRSHYPQDSKWTLIGNPPSLKDFVS